MTPQARNNTEGKKKQGRQEVRTLRNAKKNKEGPAETAGPLLYLRMITPLYPSPRLSFAPF